MHAFRIGGVQELHQPRQPPGGHLERQRPAQRLIEIRELANGRAVSRSRGMRRAEHPQPRSQELDVRRRLRELQRIESRWSCRCREQSSRRPTRAPGFRARDPCRR